MPRWLARIVYAARGKRLVRVHMEGGGAGQDTGPADLTIEGILIGRWSGHYILTRARVLESEESAITLGQGGDVEIPTERVLFLQVIGTGR